MKIMGIDIGDKRIGIALTDNEKKLSIPHSIIKNNKDFSGKLSKMLDEESEIISIYYGDEVSEEDAKNLEKQINKEYNDMEVELHHGGQPHYFYIISIE